ncbi:M48 family metallopeptidase [Rahnella sp. Lac-M11]|jgi:predicted Zn-dependent protease|uniref:Beta-barrel assembly-enhancing protease n=1 Tax=Rahnella contaminans TaxID=2703882 RepID=A0A6M2AY54_9GAMM|nr:M48 family metalloprotease [Rahnella contaminans]NGX85865.1 M48 family metallopeptidase [Rahnella contaminans]
MKTKVFKPGAYATILCALCTGGAFASTSTVSSFHYQDDPASHFAGQPVLETLPEMGTSAGSTLSVAQEIKMGDYYVRQMRAATPIIDDPLLVEYLNHLGQNLVSQAKSVRTPFHFYLVNNNELNAYAFFGGNVVLHTGLFAATEDESQLASVMAHEISHVTQRHLARAMEDQQKNSPLTWGGAFGAILLATASPQAGMAALTSTLAGSQQGMISFTQANEQEADRIGIQVLQRAGFNPQAMPLFLQKLADKSSFASKPPEMLLTHPLPESRLSDMRNRANQMPAVVRASSLDFMLAKVRVLTMYSEDQTVADEYINTLNAGQADEVLAARYGSAIQSYQAKKYDQADVAIRKLLSASPGNAWFLDIATDNDIARKKAGQAAQRLEKANAATKNNPVLILNLANAEIESGMYAKADPLLAAYTFAHPSEPNGWEMLRKVSALEGYRSKELAAWAESRALKGDLEQAIELLTQASGILPKGSLEQQKYLARIDQFRDLQRAFKNYK